MCMLKMLEHAMDVAWIQPAGMLLVSSPVRVAVESVRRSICTVAQASTCKGADIAGDASDDADEGEEVDIERYGPGVAATSGATAFFRPAAWLERRYELSGVLGECDNGIIFRCDIANQVYDAPSHRCATGALGFLVGWPGPKSLSSPSL